MALTDSLKFYFECEDNAANTTVDDSTDTLDGTLSNNTQDKDITGHIANAFTYDGVGDYIDSNYDPSGDTDWTIQMWVKWDVKNGADGLATTRNTFGSNGWWEFYINTDTSLRLSVKDSSGVDNLDWTIISGTGTWRHYVLTKDNDTVELWEDGSSLGTNTITKTIGATVDAHFGILGLDATSNAFEGDMDEIGFWTRKLTDSEIASLYNSGSGLPYPLSEDLKLQIQINDSWKKIKLIKIQINDSWADVSGEQINIGDNWKTID